VVPRAAFVGARPVDPSRMRVDPDQIRQVPVATRPSLPPPAFRPVPGAQGPRWQTGGQPMPPRDAGRTTTIATDSPPPPDKHVPRWPMNQQQPPNMQRPMPPTQNRATGQPTLTPANPNFAPGNPNFAPGNPNFAPGNPNFVPTPRPVAPPPPPQQQPGFERPMPHAPQQPPVAVPVPQRQIPQPQIHNSGDGSEGQFRPPVRQMQAPTNPGAGERPTGFRRGGEPAVQNPAPQPHANPQVQQQRQEMQHAPQQESRGQNRQDQHQRNDGAGDRRSAQ
jgi:hypothetical protein